MSTHFFSYINDGFVFTVCRRIIVFGIIQVMNFYCILKNGDGNVIYDDFLITFASSTLCISYNKPFTACCRISI